MARHQNAEWNLPEKPGTWTEVQVAILMDIRSELRKLNGIIGCTNFTEIPRILRAIQKNTTKRKYKKRVPPNG